MTMTLPPKMALQFAERAKAGEGYRLGEMVLFLQGTQEICLFSPEHPVPFGHIKKLTLAEAAEWKTKYEKETKS